MSFDKQWLVKSSDTILGPFEFDRVVENIFNGEIHLLDEIKGPFERWRPIKDHSLFAAAIEKLKASTYNGRESTMTATVDINTKTGELTKTHTLTGTNPIESTQTPIMSSTATQPEPLPDPPSASEVVFVSEQQRPRSSRMPSIFLVTFCFILIGGASFLVYEYQKNKTIEEKISLYDQLTDKAMWNLKVGEYQRALDNFNQAYSLSPNDPNLTIEMTPLLIQFDGQFSQAQLLIEKILGSQYQKSYLKQGKNIIGLSYSYQGKYAEAEKSYTESLAIDDQYLPASVNRVYTLIKQKRNDEAAQEMRRILGDFPKESIAHYLYVRSLVELAIQNSDQDVFREALSVATQFPQSFSDFLQEVLFLVAYSQFRLGVSGEEFKAAVLAVMKVDSELTNLHVHNPLLDFQSFSWVDFSGYCREMRSSLEDYEASLLEGFCLLKINRTIDAKKIFETLLAQQSNDGLLQALYASSLLKLNELSQAKNALGFINQVDQKQPMVETILRGCLNAGDLSCGQAIFKGRHAKHISLLYSHWGNSATQKGNRRQAQNSIDQGLGLSPNFSPLLKLREEIQ
ncbi:MAG: tetratricopeptide repeat protein [Pseudomonadota bacterium]